MLVEPLLAELARHGVNVPDGTGATAIVPLVVGDERRAVEVSEALAAQGFLLSAIRYPTVARGSARLRVALSAAHDRDTLAAAARAIARTGGIWYTTPSNLIRKVKDG